ncbi:MAG: hypothetical protein JWO83_913 [Caulobacteraceae bacterium]|jgi:hypothetical protein|nr:hypothetical protein [Caulobacteraceae bacterium]
MTSYKLAAAGVGAALLTLFAGSVAAARSGDGYGCLLSRASSNVHRIVTICTARTPSALTRLAAVGCDPASMSDAAMRAQCAGMTRESPEHFGDHPGGVGSR